MPLLTELDLFVRRDLQICRAYGAEYRRLLNRFVYGRLRQLIELVNGL
jgi:hypothetical protein